MYHMMEEKWYLTCFQDNKYQRSSHYKIPVDNLIQCNYSMKEMIPKRFQYKLKSWQNYLPEAKGSMEIYHLLEWGSNLLVTLRLHENLSHWKESSNDWWHSWSACIYCCQAGTRFLNPPKRIARPHRNQTQACQYT